MIYTVEKTPGGEAEAIAEKVLDLLESRQRFGRNYLVGQIQSVLDQFPKVGDVLTAEKVAQLLELSASLLVERSIGAASLEMDGYKFRIDETYE